MSRKNTSLNQTRRALLGSGLTLAVAAVAPRWTRGAGAPAAGPDGPDGPDRVLIEQFAPDGKRTGVVRLSRIVKTDAEWRAKLSPAAYQVTRRAGTERAFSGEYDGFHGDGLYRCICCDTALYDSRTKFDSGTGWPSFWQPISRFNVAKTADLTLGMSRDAIACRRCNAHLGHVFDDGPPPTGVRYCMNSVALQFVRRA